MGSNFNFTVMKFYVLLIIWLFSFKKARNFILIRELASVFLFTFILALSGQIKVYTPISSVPFTLQTLAIFLGVACLKEKILVSEILWIVFGLFGVPVFAAAGGIGAHTIGYICGFVLASVFLLRVLPYARGVVSAAGIFAAANMLIYLFGVLGLMCVLRMKVPAAVSQGVYPFIGGDIVKVMLASCVFAAMKKRG